MATTEPVLPYAWNSALDPTANILRLMAQPQFPAAARALAAVTLDGTDSNPGLATVFKDAGRYVAAMWTLYLHAGGGMTLPQLKQICASSGYVSPGRARLLLQVLEHIGFVRPVPPQPGQRARAYVPTPAFITAWCGHLVAAIRAAALIEPGIAIVADRLNEPALFQAFLRIQAARLHALAASQTEIPPFQRVFMHRYAGNMVSALFLVSDAGQEFPCEAPMPIRLNLVAARFGVSHLHIRRMLNDAMKAGLLDYGGAGTVTLSPEMRMTMRFFSAAQLVELIASATLTLAEAEATR